MYDQPDDHRCSKETIWNEIDVYNNNDNNGNKMKTNSNNKEAINCDNSTDSQWNKACMCTGPDLNGSWIPCNTASSKLMPTFFNGIIHFYPLLFVTYVLKDYYMKL